MKAKMVSIVLCMVMVASISATITQNFGPLSMNASGAGGLANSPWPMFRQNLNHTGLSPYDTSGNKGQLKWSFMTGGGVYSSPAIDSDGMIYVGSHDNKLYAINPQGSEKWNFATGGAVRSSPAIDSNGTIYVGSNDNKLYAINPDGSEKWNFTTGGDVRSSSAIDSDGTIYIGSWDHKVYAINPDGTEKWNYKIGYHIDSSPVISSDGTIYFGSYDYKLYAINLNGTEKWNFTTGGGVRSSPAIGSDGTIYIGSEDNNLYAINPNGTQKWCFITGNDVVSSPAIGSDGTIYVGSNDNNLYAINSDGTEKWNFTTEGWVHSSPAIGFDGTIYVGSGDDKIYAINSDGAEKWNYNTSGNITGYGNVESSPAIGSDGTIYVGSWEYQLYAIGTPSLEVNVTSHFSVLNSAAQSAITVHVTNGTNPVEGANINLTTDNRGMFSPQSGLTDVNGNFTSIFNAPTVTTQIICRITAQANKTRYNNGSGYADITIKPIPWPMYSHNCMRTGISPYDTSSNPGKLKWSFTTNGFVMSPVIGHDETIYVASHDEKLYAINPDGSQKWNFTIEGSIPNSPTISSDGTIYTGSGIKNKLYALDTNGIEIWNFTANGQVSSPAIGSDGSIYFSTSDNPGPNPLLYALNSNGTEKWKLTIGVNGWGYPPAIGYDGTIYVGTGEGKLYAVYPNGTEKWVFSAMDNMQDAPAIGSDGTIYIASEDQYLYAINPDGSEKWRFNTEDSSDSSPAIGYDGTIYIGSNNHNLYAINPNGTEKWRFTANSLVQTSPAIGASGIIYFGSDDFNLYAINPDGTEKWNFTTGFVVHSSPAIGTDGTIYIGSFDKKLYAIGPPNLPPTAVAGPDQTVNVGDEVAFNGSGSYDPDGIIVIFEWDFNASDGLWWETGAPPDAFGPDPKYTYAEYGSFTVTLRVTDNNGSMDTDTCEITMLVPPPLPPNLYINVSLDGNDVILYWDPPSTPGIDHYLIYRSTSQTNFDFNTVWVNTSSDNESGEAGPIPLRTMWNDTKVALPGNTSYNEQYYYVIRAVSDYGEVSTTSRTVGKWTKSFPQGVSTFSLPLAPQETMNTTIDHLLNDMNARYIKWMDPINNIWMKHGDGEVNDTQLEVGKGYEVSFDSPTNYTFTGLPGAMIRYDDDSGFSGFDPASEAKNLTAIVDPVTGNVTLNWTQPSIMGINDRYYVLRSTIRDGFWKGNYLKIATLDFDTLSYKDISNATSGTQYYYMIVPVNETGVEGASPYSIGVWTEEYLAGYDTVGIPLKMEVDYSADWYCDNIPGTVGINYYIYDEQRWSWHSTRMPAGAYDPILAMTNGYQISTSNVTKFTFIGA